MGKDVVLFREAADLSEQSNLPEGFKTQGSPSGLSKPRCPLDMEAEIPGARPEKERRS